MQVHTQKKKVDPSGHITKSVQISSQRVKFNPLSQAHLQVAGGALFTEKTSQTRLIFNTSPSANQITKLLLCSANTPQIHPLVSSFTFKNPARPPPCSLTQTTYQSPHICLGLPQAIFHTAFHSNSNLFKM